MINYYSETAIKQLAAKNIESIPEPLRELIGKKVFFATLIEGELLLQRCILATIEEGDPIHFILAFESSDATLVTVPKSDKIYVKLEIHDGVIITVENAMFLDSEGDSLLELRDKNNKVFSVLICRDGEYTQIVEKLKQVIEKNPQSPRPRPTLTRVK